MENLFIIKQKMYFYSHLLFAATMVGKKDTELRGEVREINENIENYSIANRGTCSGSCIQYWNTRKMAPMQS